MAAILIFARYIEFERALSASIFRFFDFVLFISFRFWVSLARFFTSSSSSVCQRVGGDVITQRLSRSFTHCLLTRYFCFIYISKALKTEKSTATKMKEKKKSFQDAPLFVVIGCKTFSLPIMRKLRD